MDIDEPEEVPRTAQTPQEQPLASRVKFLLAESSSEINVSSEDGEEDDPRPLMTENGKMPLIMRMRYISSSAPVHPREIPFMELDVTRAAMDDILSGKFTSKEETAESIINDYQDALVSASTERESNNNPFLPSQKAEKYRILANSEQRQADVLYDPHTPEAVRAFESLPKTIVYTEQFEPVVPLAFKYVHDIVKAAQEASAASAASAAETTINYKLDVFSQLDAYDELWRNIVWPLRESNTPVSETVSQHVSSHIMNICNHLRESIKDVETGKMPFSQGYIDRRPDNYAGSQISEIMNTGFVEFYTRTNTCLEYAFGTKNWTRDTEFIAKLWTLDHHENIMRDSLTLDLYFKNFIPNLINLDLHEIDIREPENHIFTINDEPVLAVDNKYDYNSRGDVFVTRAPHIGAKMFYVATAFLCFLTTMIISAHLKKKLELPVRVQQQIDSLLAKHAVPSMARAVEIISEYLFGFDGDELRNALYSKDYPTPRYAEVLRTLVRMIMSEPQTNSTKHLALEISRLNSVFLGYASDIAVGNTLIRNAMKSRSFMHMARMAGQGKDVLGIEESVRIMSSVETKVSDARQRLVNAVHRYINLYDHKNLSQVFDNKSSSKFLELPGTDNTKDENWHGLVTRIVNEVVQQSSNIRDLTVMKIDVKKTTAESALELATYILLITIMIASRLSREEEGGEPREPKQTKSKKRSGEEEEEKEEGKKGRKKLREEIDVGKAKLGGKFYYETASRINIQLNFQTLEQQHYSPEYMRLLLDSNTLPAHSSDVKWEVLYVTAKSLYDTLVPVSSAIMSITASDVILGVQDLKTPLLDKDAFRDMIEKTGEQGKSAAVAAVQKLCAHIAAGGRVSAGLCATHPAIQFSVHVAGGMSGGSGNEGKSGLLVSFFETNWRRRANMSDKFDPSSFALGQKSTEDSLRTYHPDLVNFLLGVHTPENIQVEIMQTYTKNNVDVVSTDVVPEQRRRTHLRLLLLAREFHDSLISKPGDVGYTDRCMEETVAFFRQYLECHDKALTYAELLQMHEKIIGSSTTTTTSIGSASNNRNVGFGIPSKMMNIRKEIQDALPGTNDTEAEFMIFSQSRARGSPMFIAQRAANLLYSESHETRAAIDVFINDKGVVTVSEPASAVSLGSKLQNAVFDRGDRTLYSIGVFQWPILRMHELLDDLEKQSFSGKREFMNIKYSERVNFPDKLLFNPYFASKVTIPDDRNSYFKNLFANDPDSSYSIRDHINERVSDSLKLRLFNSAVECSRSVRESSPLLKHIQLTATVIATNSAHFLSHEDVVSGKDPKYANVFTPLPTIIGRERAVVLETLSRGRPVETQQALLQNTMMLRSRTRSRISKFMNSVEEDMESRASSLMAGIESLFYLFEKMISWNDNLKFRDHNLDWMIDNYTVTKSGQLSPQTIGLLDFIADNSMEMLGDVIAQDMNSVIDAISSAWNNKETPVTFDLNFVQSILTERRVITRASSDSATFSSFFIPHNKVPFMKAALQHYMSTRGNVELLKIQTGDERKAHPNYKQFLYYVVMLYEWLMEPLNPENKVSKHHAFGLIKIIEALSVSPFSRSSKGLVDAKSGYSQISHLAYYIAFPSFMKDPAVVFDEGVLHYLSSESIGISTYMHNVLFVEKSTYPLLFLDSNNPENISAHELLRRNGFVRATSLFAPEFVCAWSIREYLRELIRLPKNTDVTALTMINEIIKLETTYKKNIWVYLPMIAGFSEKEFLRLFGSSIDGFTNEQRMKVELMASLCNGEGIIAHSRITAPLESERIIESWSASAAAHILSERFRRMGFKRQSPDIIINADNQNKFDVEPTLMITITASLMYRETNHVDINYFFNDAASNTSDITTLNVFIQTEGEKYYLTLS